MLRLLAWTVIAFALASETASAANWKSVRGLDWELYDRPTYSAANDLIYVRIFEGVPGRAYDTRLMTNYEMEWEMSCARDVENWRFITPGISAMAWHDVGQLSSTHTALRDNLCAQKATLPPWPGMNAD